MRITFFGGAGGVTGSKHLVETGTHRWLFDCGTFQGLSDVRERNRGFPFAPDTIDFVILSHAHLDHCGMLPLLVERGFTGRIIATPATRDVAAYMLADAAGIEEQDAAYRAYHRIGAPDDRVPLFTREDIPAVLERFEVVPYARAQRDWFEVAPDLKLKFYDAGHILGSAVSVVETEGKRIAYTGDVGAPGVPMIHDPEVPLESVSTVLLESTYGGRHHAPPEEALGRLAQVIVDVHKRGGKIIIPAFSLGRTQVIVYLLHKLTDEGRIPRLPIVVDSPLATGITEVFHSHEVDFDQESVRDFTGDEHQPLAFRNLTYTKSVEESKALNEQPGPFVIIAASGMMTAGRVVHHLRHSIADARNAILITGYQAEGTLGRRLLEGVQRVELYGDWFTVRAQVQVFNEFSAHADQEQLVAYMQRWQGLERVWLVHGEAEQADALAQVLTARGVASAHRAHEGETVEV